MSTFFFFFQAEDGIRDYKVTGVQTCALPIWSSLTLARAAVAASVPGGSSPHASRTARRACWAATQAGGRWGGDTTGAVVVIHPLGLTNQPVPVSREGAGRTTFPPRPPQVTRTSEPTSAP